MKYISNAKYGEPVETGTIYRGDNKRLDICVHTLCGCGETLYMNCRTLGIVDRKLNSTSVITAINEAQCVYEDNKPCNTSCRYSNTCIHSANKTEE